MLPSFFRYLGRPTDHSNNIVNPLPVGILHAEILFVATQPVNVMSTKDYIYLGLIALTALAFYCNGFYAGVCRSKKVYETLLNDAEPEQPATCFDDEDDKTLVADVKEFASETPFRGHKPLVRTEAAQHFGLN